MGSLRPSGAALGIALARVVLSLAAFTTLAAAPGMARAAPSEVDAPNSAPAIDRARVAYDRGVRANAAGDHARAARAFAEADALAPQAASLEAALESAMKADDASLGAELVDRADGRSPDAGLKKTLDAARARFARRTGKISVACQGNARCLAAVDGAATDARRPIYVRVGPHAVVVQRGEERLERLVEVHADQVVVVGAAEASRDAGNSAGTGAAGVAGAPADQRPRGLSPAWFYVGAAVTAVVGGAAAVSGLDALAKHDRFVDDGCGGAGSGPGPADCAERARSGESAQLRTNVLLGASAVLAVTTVALGVLAVRWDDGSRARLTVGTSRGGAMAGLELVMP